MTTKVDSRMEERNFRSHYYEKVGFRSVEEKKSLEILLKENPVDRIKLFQFALRFTVPAVHRNLLWNVLLDILPAYLGQHDFVIKQRKEQFADLQRALQIVITPGSLPQNVSTKPHMFALMKNLEAGGLRLDYVSQLENRDSRSFICIAKALSDIMHCDFELYWVTKKVDKLLKSFTPHHISLLSYTKKLLVMQDELLYKHLADEQVLQSLPLQDWFRSCFTDVLPIMPLQRILDKVIGGSSIILVFLLVTLICKIRGQILKSANVEKALRNFRDNEALAEMVVSECITSWHSYGSPTTPGSNNDCLKDNQHKLHHKNSAEIRRAR